MPRNLLAPLQLLVYAFPSLHSYQRALPAHPLQKMRLLRVVGDDDSLQLTDDVINPVHPYAILSHTWGQDHEEVTFEDVNNAHRKAKPGDKKLQFCAKQAARDDIKYIWIDTCCINKSNFTELSEAINSMFRWYSNAAKCYVYLEDVAAPGTQTGSWEEAFQKSRWFTRGWTLQELIAPRYVQFFCSDGTLLGDKGSLERQIQQVTKIPASALSGAPLSSFSISERLSWAETRDTKRPEDKAYSLLGIFNIHIPLIYGEGRNHAFRRLREEIDRNSGPAQVRK